MAIGPKIIFRSYQWNQGDDSYYHTPKKRIGYADKKESDCPNDSNKQGGEKENPKKASAVNKEVIGEENCQQKLSEVYGQV